MSKVRVFGVLFAAMFAAVALVGCSDDKDSITMSISIADELIGKWYEECENTPGQASMDEWALIAEFKRDDIIMDGMSMKRMLKEMQREMQREINEVMRDTFGKTVTIHATLTARNGEMTARITVDGQDLPPEFFEAFGVDVMRAAYKVEGDKLTVNFDGEEEVAFRR